MVLRSSSTTPRGVLVAGICLSFLASLAKASPESVIAEMEKIQGESGLRSAQLGLCLIPLEGEPDDAFGYQVERGLVPASMMKVITTATALEIAGPDYRFTTAIEISGEVDEAGTLNGHLIIRGGGDPTLAESQIASTFAKWQSSLAEAGVNKLNGSVVGDASIFDNQMLSDTWQWNDMGNYYASGANGLSIHRNLFYCTFRTSSPGARADLIGTDPKLPGIKFFNEMRVGRSGSGDQGYIYGVPYGKVYYLRGTVPADGRSFTIKGALPDPAFFAARAFTKHLSENGFEVTGDPTTIRLLRDAGESVGARQIIHTQTSTTLGSLIKETNHESNNLQAECIHRLIGLEQRDQSSISSSSSATEDYWKSKGIDMTGFYMADGCGLWAVAIQHHHPAATGRDSLPHGPIRKC
ncbi:MAG: D-alanyl-D-alanine carboxypeptidase/D-alanyl-D-alanine-endopeptidase [Verrucomicrobiota bacterium]